MNHRIRPPAGTVIPLRPVAVSVAEQQMIARKRARVDLPQVQRDFSELWGRVPQKRKGKRVA